MKLFLSLTLSLLLALSPVLSAADICCYVEKEEQTQQVSQDKTASMKNCHDEVQQENQHSHITCQCDHHTSSSLPSIPSGEIFALAGVIQTSNYINTPRLTYILDNLYRPPIHV